MTRRVVVTGLGAVTPCGNDVPTTWQAMLAARSGTATVSRFDTSSMPVHIAAEVKGFEAEARIDKRVSRRLDLFARYAMYAADEALEHAGIRPNDEGDPRFGVYVGTGIGGLQEIVNGSRLFDQQGWKGLSPFFIPRALTNLAAGQIAIRYRAQGPALCVTTACATGNHAIGEAWRAILADEADVILAGGCEAAVTPVGLAGFMAMRALSKRNDDPPTASRPFDLHRDGFVMGEGAGILVLEELEHARARGATVLAELIGYGLNNDAWHDTAPSPGGAGAARCMQAALRSARIAPDAVDYINAHGTSTPQNDSSETAALKTAFGDHARKVMVSSTKGVTGHLLGAAGGVEAVATVLALHQQRVPPTANLVTPDPECDLDYVPLVARDARLRTAISNSFGFGGVNATLVFRTFEG
ncbi:MAG: beta-ketoacyl-[acyl-carrier-protein] synthase II [Myxococcales bacterium]|nr:beta-ketoacyl-[acyl-carrier-protein] synthase II [Myxococcales bacterium]